MSEFALFVFFIILLLCVTIYIYRYNETDISLDALFILAMTLISIIYISAFLGYEAGQGRFSVRDKEVTTSTTQVEK